MTSTYWQESTLGGGSYYLLLPTLLPSAAGLLPASLSACNKRTMLWVVCRGLLSTPLEFSSVAHLLTFCTATFCNCGMCSCLDGIEMETMPGDDDFRVGRWFKLKLRAGGEL